MPEYIVAIPPVIGVILVARKPSTRKRFMKFLPDGKAFIDSGR